MVSLPKGSSPGGGAKPAKPPVPAKAAKPAPKPAKPPKRPRQRTLVVGPLAIVAVFCAFALVSAWAAVATGIVLFGDKLSARLVAQQTDMQFAYEQKLVVFRAQLDRFARQTRVDRDSVEGHISELMLRQAAIEARQAMLNALAEQTRVSDTTRQQAAAPVAPASSFAILPPSRPPRDRADHLEQSMGRVETAQVRALSGFLQQSTTTLGQMRAAFVDVGLDPELYSPSRTVGRGSVATILPASADIGGGPFEENYVAIRRTLSVLGRLKTAAVAVPFRRPVGPPASLSSPFGTRSDPFTGEGRFHSGLDFRAPEGTPVLAGGSGVVLSASVAGGYGNLVQVDHGNGIVSRYAHLSAMAVTEGQPVAQGMVIGYVGTTGRSTGPHLHYETRLKSDPLDPMRFLRAGTSLFGQSNSGG